MIHIHYGRYRLLSRRVGYRADYCLTCDSPRIAEQYRTLDLFHIYFVPLLPLGLWRHWHCQSAAPTRTPVHALPGGSRLPVPPSSPFVPRSAGS
jgi:hypothetical protein